MVLGVSNKAHSISLSAFKKPCKKGTTSFTNEILKFRLKINFDTFFLACLSLKKL